MNLFSDLFHVWVSLLREQNARVQISLRDAINLPKTFSYIVQYFIWDSVLSNASYDPQLPPNLTQYDCALSWLWQSKLLSLLYLPNKLICLFKHLQFFLGEFLGHLVFAFLNQEIVFCSSQQLQVVCPVELIAASLPDLLKGSESRCLRLRIWKLWCVRTLIIVRVLVTIFSTAFDVFEFDHLQTVTLGNVGAFLLFKVFVVNVQEVVLIVVLNALYWLVFNQWSIRFGLYLRRQNTWIWCQIL